MVKEYLIELKHSKTNPRNMDGTAPKLTDPTTPGITLEFPTIWLEWFQEYATKGKVVKNE